MLNKLCLFMTLISITPHSIAFQTVAATRIPSRGINVGVREISRLIQECKNIIQQAHTIAVKQAAEQLQRRGVIASALTEKTTLPRELIQMVADYEPNCIDYADLLTQAISPFAEDIARIDKEANRVVSLDLPIHLLNRSNHAYPAYNALTEAEAKHWQSAGFSQKLSHSKLDSLYCTHCDVAVYALQYPYGDYGAESYMEPADYHNYTRPHPKEIKKLQAVALQTEEQLNNCSAVPNVDNPEFTRYVLRHLNMKARIVNTDKKPSHLVFPAKQWDNLHTIYNQLHMFGRLALHAYDPEGFKKLNVATYQDIQDALASTSKNISAQK
jgi:hypothetical protein